MSEPGPATGWAVFTKPWRTLPADELADLVRRLGFDSIEFPLRPGFQVDLDRLPTSLGEFVGVLGDRGLRIASVASATTPAVFEACARYAIPLLRIMVPVAPEGYVETGDAVRRQLDGLVPLAEQYGVRIGIQPHVNDYIADSSELATLLRDYDPRAVAAIWDAAHDALARKHPSHALALLWDHLAMVNFKNACYLRGDTPAGTEADWKITFVEGREGLGSWPEAAAFLRDRGYAGPVCMPAEYTDETDLEAKVAADLTYLRGLLAG